MSSLHASLNLEGVYSYSVTFLNGPFTLAIFAAISAAISSAMLPRVNY